LFGRCSLQGAKKWRLYNDNYPAKYACRYGKGALFAIRAYENMAGKGRFKERADGSFSIIRRQQ